MKPKIQHSLLSWIRGNYICIDMHHHQCNMASYLGPVQPDTTFSQQVVIFSRGWSVLHFVFAAAINLGLKWDFVSFSFTTLIHYLGEHWGYLNKGKGLKNKSKKTTMPQFIYLFFDQHWTSIGTKINFLRFMSIILNFFPVLVSHLFFFLLKVRQELKKLTLIL